MKILIIYGWEITLPGGVNKTIRETAKNFVKNGHSVTIIQGNRLNLPKEEIIDGYNIIRVKSPLDKYLYGFNGELLFQLKKYYTDFKPQIVHIHGYHTLFAPEIIYLIRKLDADVPIIFTPHYDSLNRGTFLGKLLGRTYDKLLGEKILKKTDCIVSISDFEAENIRKIHPTGKITVIPHGVNHINIKKSEKKDEIKLLYVGYLLYYKGVQDIIKSLDVLINIKNIPNIKLTIIGEGKYKSRLLKLSKNLELDEYIEWKPFLSNQEILEEMKTHDIFLLLSRSEGYGIVVAEALSMGTTAIVTKKTALEEFTREKGCFGVDCPPKPEEVADLIIKIHEKDCEVGPFSEKIKTWPEVTQKYEKTYKDVLNAKKN